MKKYFLIASLAIAAACNNNKKEEKTPASNETGTKTTETTPPPATSANNQSGIVFTIEGVEIKNFASLLVTKDKDIKQADAPYLCMLTSNAATNNNEYLTLNFLMNTRPGTYPVAGISLQRGKSPNDQMFGSLLGGKPKLTDFKVTLTECKDLGDNGSGGHKWSISGTCEQVVIPATPMMLIDNTNNHPKEIKVEKISFTNLTFDDNWEQLMEEGLKKLKENK